MTVNIRNLRDALDCALSSQQGWGSLWHFDVGPPVLTYSINGMPGPESGPSRSSPRRRIALARRCHGAPVMRSRSAWSSPSKSPADCFGSSTPTATASTPTDSPPPNAPALNTERHDKPRGPRPHTPDSIRCPRGRLVVCASRGSNTGVSAGSVSRPARASRRVPRSRGCRPLRLSRLEVLRAEAIRFAHHHSRRSEKRDTRTSVIRALDLAGTGVPSIREVVDEIIAGAVVS